MPRLTLVFAFASAHHFAAHRKTFQELHRVLGPAGQALYFYEPSCHPMFLPPRARAGEPQAS
jgi:hypothetical protein